MVVPVSSTRSVGSCYLLLALEGSIGTGWGLINRDGQSEKNKNYNWMIYDMHMIA